MNKQDYLNLLKNPYIKAGLDTIAKCEGVQYGYYTLYGNSKIDSLAAHPNIKVTKWGITSTAAGRYQFLTRTWNDIATKLGLTDFSEQNQDVAALYLMNQQGALDALAKGDVLSAFYRIRKIWASLPGAGYGQKERTKSDVQKWFTEAYNALKKKSQA